MSRVRAALCVIAALAGTPASAGLFDDITGQINRIQKGVIGDVVVDADRLLARRDPRREAAMGQAAAAVLLGAAPPLDDEATQAYVNRVGLWIALHSERPDLEWRFAVLDDDTVNAFAAPAGYVFVTRGLFLLLRDEAELAGVLGHEIAHVVAYHHVDALATKAIVSQLAGIASNASGQIDIFSGELSTVARYLVAATRDLYISGLDQGVELEADRMGVVLAARAGYDPFGLPRVLQTMEGIQRDTHALGFLLATHPPPRARIEALDGAAGPALENLGGSVPNEPLAGIQARLRQQR